MVAVDQSLSLLKCQSQLVSRTGIIKSQKNLRVGWAASKGRNNMRAVLWRPGCFGNGAGGGATQG